MFLGAPSRGSCRGKAETEGVSLPLLKHPFRHSHCSCHPPLGGVGKGATPTTRCAGAAPFKGGSSNPHLSRRSRDTLPLKEG